MKKETFFVLILLFSFLVSQSIFAQLEDDDTYFVHVMFGEQSIKVASKKRRKDITSSEYNIGDS